MYFELRLELGKLIFARETTHTTMAIESAFNKKVIELSREIGFDPKCFKRGAGEDTVKIARWEKFFDGEEIYGKSPYFTATQAKEDMAGMNHYADAFRYAREFTKAQDPQESLRNFISMMQQFRGRI